jgi:membrane protease YdiL (CAAX protease family)
MKNIFYNENKQIRNGWWILLFIGFVALTRPIYKPIKQGLSQLGFTEQMLEPVSFLLLLLVTWICVKLRKESLSDVGMGVNLRWFKHFFTGTLAGIGMIFVIVALIWAFGGITFELDEQRSFQVLNYGLYLFLMGALGEEILHRGFIFQRLIDGIGVWGAQLLIASLFALGHWGNPGMEGTTQVFATFDLFLASLIFGLAYIKTRSLALPIGLHLGWNWAQGNILGFGVSGHDKAGWFKPVFHGMEEWLTGGDFGPEASIFSIAVSIITLAILINWKGSEDKPNKSAKHFIENPAVTQV